MRKSDLCALCRGIIPEGVAESNSPSKTQVFCSRRCLLLDQKIRDALGKYSYDPGDGWVDINKIIKRRSMLNRL